jgi:hypothetical protein
MSAVVRMADRDSPSSSATSHSTTNNPSRIITGKGKYITVKQPPIPIPIYIGIDPQPTFLSINCTTDQNTLVPDTDPKTYTVSWFNHYLKKKSAFGCAQAWQEHIFEECYKILHTVIPRQCEEKCYPNLYDIKLVSVEQQKGRVNTILEQTILCVCKQLALPALILHPLTWKKTVGLECGGGNKKNKELVVEMTHDTLVAFFGDYQAGGTKLRVHDLCDAYQIRRAGYTLILRCSSNSPTHTQVQQTQRHARDKVSK